MNKITKRYSTINAKSVLFALLGSAIIAFGTYNIHANSDIPEGGIIGLCLIIEYYTQISPAISNIVITAFCYLLAWRLMGTKFIANASIATLGFSAFYALFSAFPPVIPAMSQYPLLAALIGALFIELGTGITLRYGSAPTGEHALSMAIVKKGGFNFGWVHFLRDFVVIILSICYVEDFYAIVYAILIMTVTTPLTEFIVNAPKKTKLTRRIVKTKTNWIPIVITGLVITILLSVAAFYINDIYEADKKAIREFASENVEGVEEVVLDDIGAVAYVPETDAKAGFVFYPGAKVEFTAYAPLLMECAENGILCVVVEMPYNLAFLGFNKGLDVVEQFPEIESWYIGGHSLGGTMAANCAANHPDIFEGVILVGSYSTTDISNMKVLTVRGSVDKIVDTVDYNQFEDKLPENAVEKVIIGGNHAYFGMYGEQDNDGKATISNVQQILTTAEYIYQFILE